ncbi:PASTA domain-containing protein [Tunturibacter empetritectus]|uniref:Beta-lactam-binding protein with PASTA domain n=1 Tax=Tunturiibacter lichenicola TaxID=2051959 RepID=A0A7W8N4C3_9BACT|nr:PASTA domain-containing protein [Edaphobacter lichenicola]MBB5342800.1 beta-lactam-binding protein with PASTA domain [Edaphobacter lichenicola]
MTPLLPRKVSRSINRFFNIVLGALAMLTVALVSAFITMRLAIHGHEVKVPDLTSLTLSEASKKTSSLGLVLSLENRFYSPNTPPGRVLAQSPAPGLTVRREWPVRVTESLGAQQVAIPDLLGQTERTATINIRRLGLELGAVSHIAAPGEPGVVIAQTPTPNAIGVDRPRVSLLLSDPETATSAEAFVMPSLAGLTLAAAAARAASAGLHIASAEDLNLNSTSPEAAAPTPQSQPTQSPPNTTAPAFTEPIAHTVSSIGTVIAQTPPAGHRVVKGDPVHITLTD